MQKQILSLLLLVLVCGPTMGGEEYSSGIPNLPGNPSPDSFPVCYNYTCEIVREIGIKPAQWTQIRDIFRSTAENAAMERELIAQAVAQMEKIVGKIVNSTQDKGGNFKGVFADGNQMDCIDESSNTTTYMAMMQKDGLLHWHQVIDTKTRGFFIFGWPHTTAVIKENKTKQSWAVDSWFYDNGIPPAIIPIAKWSDGWEPEQK